MTVGTRSVIYGAHCFFLHPWFVAWAWWTLYGFPFDPRLWVAFFIHDLGYISKINMDGPEGEKHPEFAARWMSRLFDRGYPKRKYVMDSYHGEWMPDGVVYGAWGEFCLLHSRYYAKTMEKNPSRLCMADKLAIALTPAWLYLPMVRATGEIHEYMALGYLTYDGQLTDKEKQLYVSGKQKDWYAGVQSYVRRWAFEHKDGKADTWTSNARQRATVDDHGTWK